MKSSIDHHPNVAQRSEKFAYVRRKFTNCAWQFSGCQESEEVVPLMCCRQCQLFTWPHRQPHIDAADLCSGKSVVVANWHGRAELSSYGRG
jgi:hypothetical protein